LADEERSDVVIIALYADEKNFLIKKSIITTKEIETYRIEMLYAKFNIRGLTGRATFVFNTKDYKLPKRMTFEYENGEKKSKSPGAANPKGKVEITYSNYIINKGISDLMFK
jgi:hypothetical protein